MSHEMVPTLQTAIYGFPRKVNSKFGANSSDKTPIEWEETKPLQRILPPSSPFPVEALGEILGSAAQILSDVIKAPIAICGQSVLAAAALAIQGHANVVIDGRGSPLSEFFVTIGESGERKSAVDNQALYEHRHHQIELKNTYESESRAYQIKAEAFKKAKEDVLKKEKGRLAKEDALIKLGTPPQAPLEPFYIITEPTYEGLVKLLAVGQPSVGLFSDEGGQFIGGHGMNNDNMLKTAAGLSGLWDGKEISRTRAGDGSSLLVGRRLSCHLMLQPNISSLMLSSELLKGQGLLSRCLVTWPTSTAGTRKYNATDLSASAEMKLYWNTMNSILNAPFQMEENMQNELSPRPLYLEQAAKLLWVNFHDAVESEVANGKTLAPIRGLANKAPEHAARLAGILALVTNLQCQSVGLDHMKSGIQLMTHYLDEALRLFNAGIADPELIQAEELLQWLRDNKKSTITLVEIYQYGPNSIRDAKKARVTMKSLVDHGWALPSPNGAIFEDKLRKESWVVKL